VLLCAALLFLWQLGSRDLWAPDEPYFAEGAREMIIDGRWVVPHVNGVVTPDKPPLFFWLIALFSLPTGVVTPFTARLPSVLASLGTLALVMRLGERWFGGRTAALAGAMLATTVLFWNKAIWSQTDALLCFWIWLALSAFDAWRSGTSGARNAGLLFWIAAALAVLTKGPVGFLLPLGITICVLVWDRGVGRWRSFAPISGPALFVAILGSWVVLTEVAGPADYSVWTALQDHFINRGIQGMHHKQPPWYFLETLPGNLLPWTGLIPGALVLAWRRRLRADRFLFTVAAFVLLFFSISTEKRELYALPAFPAFALMVAALVAAVCGWCEVCEEGGDEGNFEPHRRWVTLGHGFVAGLLIVMSVAIGVLANRSPELAYGPFLLVAATLAGTGLAVFFFLRHKRVLPAVLAPAVGMALTYLLAVWLIAPVFEPSKSARPFSLEIKAVTEGSRAAGLPVVAYGLGNLPEHFAFYSDGVYTVETDDLDELRRHLERPENVFAVAHGGRLAALPSDLAARLHVVEETRLARRDVWLIANHDRAGARRFFAVPGPD